MKRRMRTAVKIALGIIIGLPLVVVIINTDLFDEAYDPELARILEGGRAPVAVEENAYIYAAGIDAPPGQSPGVVGAQYIAVVSELLQEDPEDEGNRLADLETRYFGDRAHLQVLEDSVTPRCSIHRNAECVAERVTRRDAIAAAHAASAEQLVRYERLFTFSHYRPTMIESFYAPFNSVSMQWYVNNDRIILLAEGGELDAALDLLGRELDYTRMLLAEATVLIDKMLAATRMDTLLWLLHDLDRRYSFSPPQLARAQQLVSPLSAEAYSMRQTLEGEIRWTVGATNNVTSAYEADSLADYFSGEYWTWVLTQPRATHNLLYQWYVPLLALSDMSAPQYIAAVEELDIDYLDPGMDIVYNPVGKILAGVTMPDLSRYIERMHDLEAKRRLIALYLEIRQRGNIDIESITAQDAYLDPYTLTPIDWNVETRTLTGRCRDPESRCSITLR